MKLNKMLTVQKSVTEEDLLKGCRKGKSQAQKTLYEKLAPRMLGVCCRYIRDHTEAEHVMVGGFVKVFEKISQFNEQGSFEGWIRRIMVNECLMYLRKNRPMSVEVDIEIAENEPNYSELETEMDTALVMGMIESLPIGYRTVFNLYAIEGYNHAEIGEKLGINENTSKSQLSRARKILQARLMKLAENENIKRVRDESS